jgi:4-amino-4-deoxy-L-arabinose transferase-like glycosyltransferase
MITAAPRVTVASDDPKDGADASKHDIPIEVPSGTAARLRATRRREHAALAVLLAGTALLYMWGLDRSGWANTFYSAAVQAGTKSWKAFFFGSSDASNFITVDKPPLALWPMEIAARVFGLSSWTVLVPQAIEGVASVALLYAAVRRWFGAHAGLLGGAV